MFKLIKDWNGELLAQLLFTVFHQKFLFNSELKKLVYLYLMNYAKSQPDMAIMAVNTFVKVNKHYLTW